METQSLRPISPPPSVSNRAVSIVLAAALNVGIVYALITGLASDAVRMAIQNIKVAVIPPPPDVSKPPPPPPPQIKEPPPFVPPPDINIDITEAAPATTAITNVQTTVPTTPAPVPNTPPRASNNHSIGPNEYPAISVRLSEQGTVIVSLLVLEDGTVGDSQLVTTSGHPRLDEAALRVTRSRWRYHPAIQNGKPVQMRITAKVIFNLR